ncbi:HNH endonuclease [Maricaulis sp. CAU 1757]
MTKVVLMQSVESSYSEVPGRTYYVPRRYVKAAREAIGDLCLFYEPRAGGGRLAYFAVAMVSALQALPHSSGDFVATINGYLEFNKPVPLKSTAGRYREAKLYSPDGSSNQGAFGVSVRRIPDEEFELICAEGFSDDLFADVRTDPPGLSEPPAVFRRPIVEQLVSRKFRDAAFAKTVRDAYDRKCAVTGLQIINGGGRAEMEAAHIRPVADDGPDSIRNGLALSRTAHWLFDRGLIAIDDDFRLLKAEKLLPEGAQRLFDPSGFVRVPERAQSQPHPEFLKYHRDTYFKG